MQESSVKIPKKHYAYATQMVIGFYISIITVTAGLSGLALLSYPISIILRVFGWYRLGRTYGKIFWITGFVVAVAGSFTLIFILETISNEVSGKLLNPFFYLPWAFYSIFEALSYYQIRREIDLRFPLLSLSSIPAVIIFLYLYFNKDASGFFLGIGVALLIISSIAAIIGFQRLKITKTSNSEITHELPEILTKPDIKNKAVILISNEYNLSKNHLAGDSYNPKSPFSDCASLNLM